MALSLSQSVKEIEFNAKIYLMMIQAARQPHFGAVILMTTDEGLAVRLTPQHPGELRTQSVKRGPNSLNIPDNIVKYISALDTPDSFECYAQAMGTGASEGRYYKTPLVSHW